MDIYELLTSYNIEFDKYDHEAVTTCDEANKLSIEIPGLKTKNLFLRDRKRENYFLLVTADDRQVEINKLAKTLNSTRLSFASAEELEKHLKVNPGAVSFLALLNDIECNVQLILDSQVWDASQITCHPLNNTSTLVISGRDLPILLDKLGNSFSVIDL